MKLEETVEKKRQDKKSKKHWFIDFSRTFLELAG